MPKRAPPPPDRDQLLALAGSRAFDRGEAYAEDGAVGPLRLIDGGVSARVAGTTDYDVTLQVKDDEPSGRCSCPVGGRGVFCKHAVAVGLVWIAAQDEPDLIAAPGSSADDIVTDYLLARSKDELVALIEDLARRDDRTRARLESRAAAARTTPQNVASLRRALDRAIRIRGFVHYSDAPSYAEGVDDALDVLDDLLAVGHGAVVVELAEHALTELDRAIEHIDDSDGGMGVLKDRVVALHLAACEQARPDPVALAGRIFEQIMTSGFETLIHAPVTHAGVLGATGGAELRRLAEVAWSKVPPLGPGEDDARRWGERFRITHLMEQLATQAGDVDALVDVMARDLSMPYAFLKVAETLATAGRDDEALAWAERGWAAFPAPRDGRLRAFLADAYVRAGRTEDALALDWDAFAEKPSAGGLRRLLDRVPTAGERQALQQRAVALLRERLHEPAALGASPPGHLRLVRAHDQVALRSVLVEVLLVTGDVEAAWLAAHGGECGIGTLAMLAYAMGHVDVDRAVGLYRQLMDVALVHAHASGYRQAADYCACVGVLLVGAGRRTAFVEFERELRESQKRRPKFQRILTEILRRHGPPGPRGVVT